jgi:hypothetical protein
VNPIWKQGRFAFSFLAPDAHTNSVQFKNNMAEAIWQTVANFPGFGARNTVTNGFATNASRYCRSMTE